MVTAATGKAATRRGSQQLSTRHDREDDRDRMQADAIADQPGRQPETFQGLPDREHHEHQGQLCAMSPC